MTPEDSTIQTGMIIAAESFNFGFEAGVEAGEGSGPTTSLSASCSGFALRNCACSTISIGRALFSKNFSVAMSLRKGEGGGRKGSEFSRERLDSWRSERRGSARR